MIKIHKLEDGDIIKILPMVGDNNEIIMFKKLDVAHIGKSIIFDTKSYLKRISYELHTSGRVKLPISTRYYMNILIDNEIRLLHVGRTLFNLILDNPKLWDIKGNHQIFVVKKEVSAGGGQVFPDWKSSYVSEKSWTPPVNDINSQDEWLSYIKSNGPDFNSHLQKSNIFNHKQLLIDYLGKDMLSELISDDREKKLEMIL